MNLLIDVPVLAETGAAATGSPIGALLPFLLIGAAFYFLIIRPQRKRQAEQQAMLRRVSEGDEIVTIGGFHGRIVALEEDTMELELAPGVIVTMARTAISRALTEPAPITFDDDDDLDEFDDDEFDFDNDDDIVMGDADGDNDTNRDA
ncbi:preprotein translocase subunit YajC [Euzebya rosea]|uniref:preprotein translocase subunit YajC n=1 Tax=Euzebya rosea TaxID=2052804 RepID=UPI000D3E8C8D|nr:preprotein translocase subunit YajC [Euzebya rosea]